MGFYNDYLQHHGILGQKWGVRRFQRKDGTRIPTGVLLSNYGDYKLPQVYKSKNGERGIADLDKALYNDRIDTISKQRVVTTIDKAFLDMSDSEKRETISLINSENGKYNCQFCTAAFDVLMKTGRAFSIRGDVDSGSFEGDSLPKRLYKNFPGFKPLQGSSCLDVASKLIKESGEGSFGRVNVSGHAMSYYIQNGKLRIVESQNKRDFSPEEIDIRFKSAFNWASANFARTDNLDFTDDGLEYLARFAQRNKS